MKSRRATLSVVPILYAIQLLYESFLRQYLFDIMLVLLTGNCGLDHKEQVDYRR